MPPVSREMRAGLLRLKQQLVKEFPAKVEAEFQKVTEQNARELTAAIRRDAPVNDDPNDPDPGALRDSVRYEITNNRNRATVKAGGIPTVSYPTYLEFGTKHALARRFFWTNWRVMKKRLLGRYQRALTKIAKAMQGKL